MAKKQQAGAELGLQALKRDLKQHTLQKGYIFYGEEAYLRDTYLTQLKKAVLEGPAADLNYHRFNRETFSWQAIADAVEAIPMMAERTLVQVDDVSLYKAAESDQEILKAILSDLPEHCCLVFVYGDGGFDRDKRKKSLDQLIEQKLCLVEFTKQSPRDLCAWIARHVKAGGKEISGECCQLLCFRTGGVMATLASEIPKLVSYASGPEITRADIEATVEPVLDAVVYDITNAIADKNFELAMEKLHEVLRMQEEPIAILAAIGSNLRRTYCARALIDQGKGVSELMQLTGLRSEYAARKTLEAARGISVRFCEAALVGCMQTDLGLKNSVDDSQRLLELLIMSLAQEARRD